MTRQIYSFNRQTWLFAFLLCSFISSCGGGGNSMSGRPDESISSSSSLPAQEKLYLISSSPVSQSADVDRNTPLDLFFNKELKHSSITPEKVMLQDEAGNNVPVAIEAIANKLTLSPLQRLARGTQYSVKVVGLQGQSGEALTDGKLLSFNTTIQREWGSAFQVDSTNNASKPHATIDGNGNAILVWQQNTVVYASIGYSTYSRGVGWATPGVLPSVSYEMKEVKVAYVDNRHAVAVWRLGGCKQGAIASAYTIGVGWDAPREIGPSTTDRCVVWSNETISLSSNRAGKAIVAYNNSGAVYSPARDYYISSDSIFSSTYLVGEGWKPAQVVSHMDESEDVPNGYETPNVFMNNRGDAFLSFVRSYGDYGTGHTYHIELHQHTTGDLWRWGLPGSPIENNKGYLSPTVVVDERGDATFIWRVPEQWHGDRRIFAQRVSASLEAGPKKDITEGTGAAYGSAIAIDSGGNVSVTWLHYSEEGTYRMYMNRYLSLSGSWEGPEGVAMNANYANSESLQIAADKDGNVVVVWLQKDDAKTNVYSRRYLTGSGWEDARLHSNVDGDAYNPLLALGPDGDSIISWESRGPMFSKIFVTMFD